MTSEHKDKKIARLFLMVSSGILIYWIYQLIVWSVKWFSNFNFQTAGTWSSFGGFCLNNLSIILVIYVIICLQIAGVVELRYRRNFTEAFYLGIFTTPIIMLIFMKRRNKSNP